MEILDYVKQLTYKANVLISLLIYLVNSYTVFRLITFDTKKCTFKLTYCRQNILIRYFFYEICFY